MQKIEIDKNLILNPGDVVELHYKTPGGKWMKATEAAIVEYALEGREDFRINSIDYLQPGKIIIEVKVLTSNPVLVTIAVISASIAIVALAFGWMFDKAYLVGKTVPAQAISVGFVIVAVIVAFMYLRK